MNTLVGIIEICESTAGKCEKSVTRRDKKINGMGEKEEADLQRKDEILTLSLRRRPREGNNKQTHY